MRWLSYLAHILQYCWVWLTMGNKSDPRKLQLRQLYHEEIGCYFLALRVIKHELVNCNMVCEMRTDIFTKPFEPRQQESLYLLGGCGRVEGCGSPAAAGRGMPKSAAPSAVSVGLPAEAPSNNSTGSSVLKAVIKIHCHACTFQQVMCIAQQDSFPSMYTRIGVF